MYMQMEWRQWCDHDITKADVLMPFRPMKLLEVHLFPIPTSRRVHIHMLVSVYIFPTTFQSLTVMSSAPCHHIGIEDQTLAKNSLFFPNSLSSCARCFACA